MKALVAAFKKDRALVGALSEYCENFRETWLAALVISYQLSIPGVSSSPLPPPPLSSCTAAAETEQVQNITRKISDKVKHTSSTVH